MPVVMLGNWAIWPTLTDLIYPVMLVVLARAILYERFPPLLRRLSIWLIACTIGCALSYVVMTLWNPAFSSPTNGKASQFGAFQLYRLVQYNLILWAVSVTPMTTHQMRILRNILTAVLMILNCSILLDYFSVIPTSVYSFALSRSAMVSGPWAWYAASNAPKGLGTVGYNHAYAAAQVLLVYAFRSRCNLGKSGLIDTVLLLLTCMAAFVSGSRAGLITCGVVLLGQLLATRRRLILCLALAVGVSLGAVMATRSDLSDEMDYAVHRQSTAATSYEEDGLSGRNVIWGERVKFLNANFARWIVGTGFGTAVERGTNAHMLLLQVINEVGLIGALIFVALAAYIMRMLWYRDVGWKPMFWATLAFAIGSFTQETFYPVPALGHFTALYLCAIACTFHLAPRQLRTNPSSFRLQSRACPPRYQE